MPKFFNHLKRGGSAVIAGALVLLALAGTTVAAQAASASTFTCNWQQLTLTNGWQSEQSAYVTGNPAFCALDNGMVYLSGSMAQPVSGSNQFAVLPSWARPAHNLYLSVYTYQGADGIVQIDTNGSMYAYNAQYQGDARDFTSLAGISFPAAGAAAEKPLTLLNGWQSAQSQWGTGDPSYSAIDGVIHLNGSLNGKQVTPGLTNDAASTFAVLPQGARPDYCSAIGTYDYAGTAGTMEIEMNGTLHSYAPAGEVYGSPAASYTSLAGVSFPAAGTVAWLPLALQNGWASNWTDCPSENPYPYSPSYAVLNGVVYLTGMAWQYPTKGGVFATLPSGARPAHTLYLTVETGGTSNGYLRISPNGEMYVWFKDNSDGFSLTGLSYQLSS